MRLFISDISGALPEIPTGMPLTQMLQKTQNGAIQLSEEDLARARTLLDMYLPAAKSARQDLDAAVEAWRRYVRLDKRPETPWAGAPNVTTPLIRQKVDGVEAHIAAALDVDPMVSAVPMSKSAEGAQMALEAAMQKEIEETDSRVALFDAIHDAAVTGTGHLKMVVLANPNRQNADGSMGYTVGFRYVKFENLYVWPVNNPNRHRLSYFERYVLPFWEMKEMAAQGIFDEDAVDKLKESWGISKSPTGEDETGPKNSVFFTDATEPMVRNHEVFQCYIRFQPTGAESMEFWVFEYHPASSTIISAAPYTWGKWFNYAPYHPLYIKRRPGYYYGDSVPELLEPLQEVADAAFNNELASAQFKMAPHILVRRGSALARKLANKSLAPGGVTEVDGDFDMYLKVLDFGANQFNYQLIQLVNSMAEDATFSDGIIPGDPSAGKRVTATWARLSANIGTLKLRRNLSTVKDCINPALADLWQLIYAYVIAPAGLYSVYTDDENCMLSTEEGQIPKTDGTEGTVTAYKALRDDIRWVVKGGDTVPDKEARLQKFLEIQQLDRDGFFQKARVDRGTWELAKLMLEAMNVYRWSEFIGRNPPPPRDVLEPMIMQQAEALIKQRKEAQQELIDDLQRERALQIAVDQRVKDAVQQGITDSSIQMQQIQSQQPQPAPTPSGPGQV